MNLRWFGAVAALVCIAMLAVGETVLHPAVAQEAAGRSDHIDPKQRAREFDEIIAEKRRAKKAPLPKRQTGPSGQGADIRPLFKLSAVTLEGAESFSESRLAPTYESFIGKTVSQADLLAITAAISELYRAAGFHLSRAIIPPQDIQGGRLRIQVIEGRIAQVTVKGEGAEVYGGRSRLAPILAENPSRLGTLERHLLLFNDTPGLTIKDTALEEIGTASGNFRLIVYVEAWRFFAAAGLDNRGTPEVGPVQLYAAPYLNSAFVPGDSLGFNLATVPNAPKEMRYGRTVYDVPLGGQGTRIAASASISDVWPDDERRSYDDHVRTVSFEVRGTVVPLRSRVASVWLSVAGTVTDDREESAFGLSYADYTRTISLSSDIQLVDPFGGSNYLTVALVHGLDVLGASRQGDAPLSRADASGSFSKLGLSYIRDQKLLDGLTLYFSGAAQFTQDPLLASEEFYIGGSSFGRSFDGGELSGDIGVAGSLELRFGRQLENHWLKSYQLYAFVDGGRVWDIQDGADAATSLMSAGGGVRLGFAHDIQLGFEVAAPLKYRTSANSSGSPRVFLTLSKSLKICGACGSAEQAPEGQR